MKVNLTNEERLTHPARFALVEALNIYDKGLIFEPIHRVIFNPSKDFLKELESRLGGEFESFSYSKESGKKPLYMPKNGPMCYKKVQSFIDEYLSKHSESSVDYIHDVDQLIEVADSHPGSIAIVMPALTKGDIFDYIAADDVLPRKSFSMGHATEKRYYLESKRIK